MYLIHVWTKEYWIYAALIYLGERKIIWGSWPFILHAIKKSLSKTVANINVITACMSSWSTRHLDLYKVFDLYSILNKITIEWTILAMGIVFIIKLTTPIFLIATLWINHLWKQPKYGRIQKISCRATVDVYYDVCVSSLRTEKSLALCWNYDRCQRRVIVRNPWYNGLISYGLGSYRKARD